jgi:hypothetical protein
LCIKDNGVLSLKGVLVVRNPSNHTSADDVLVKLLEIEPPPSGDTAHLAMAALALKNESVSEPPRMIHPQDSSDYDAFVFSSLHLGFTVMIDVALRGPTHGLSFLAELAREELPPLFKDYFFKLGVSARGRAQVIRQFKVTFDHSGKDLAVVVSKVGGNDKLEAE